MVVVDATSVIFCFGSSKQMVRFADSTLLLEIFKSGTVAMLAIKALIFCFFEATQSLESIV